MKRLSWLIFFLYCSLGSNLYGFDLKNYLEDYLKSEFGFEDVYVDNIKVNGDVTFPPQKINVEKLQGRFLKLSLVMEGQILDAKADIRAYKKVVISKQGLEKGRKITEDDVMEAVVEHSRVPKGAITDIFSIVGKTLKSSMPANTVFVENKLTAIKKGDLVIIKIQNSYFDIKMEGKALEDGNVGNLIKVLNVASNKVIKGVVNDDKTVVIF